VESDQKKKKEDLTRIGIISRRDTKHGQFQKKEYKNQSETRKKAKKRYGYQ